ncbi:MAG: HAL/PAL/TAL family ammonia-lyase [Ferrovibrionaceae bacterium]
MTDRPTVADIVAIARNRARLEVSARAASRVQAARAVVERYAASEVPVYGLTTALGAGVDTRLSNDDLIAFQRRTVPARAVAVGWPAPTEVVRAMMAVRAVGMMAGGCGVSLPVLEGLVAALNAGVHPIVPSLGSIGAGDLAPLAHMADGLLGAGDAEYRGMTMPAAEALAAAGLKPLDLGLKDGHALLVANSYSVGQACLALADLDRLSAWLDLAVVLNFEGFRANLSVLDDRALAARPAFGQRRAAERLRGLLDGSGLWQEGAARRVQDPLSYRCVPQVLGACIHALEEAREATAIELASSGDNPVVLAADGLILSHGNFDLTAFVLAWERLGQALVHVATGTAYRTLKIMSPGFSDLPRFLTPLGQSRTGSATVQKTVSAMEAEIRHLALPASFAPLPAADGVEDQASMAPSVMAKTAGIVERLRYLVAIELIASAQAVDLRKIDVALGSGAAAAHRFVRDHVPMLEEDRAQGHDFIRLADAVQHTDPADIL